MLLYHGSNVAVPHPRILESDRTLDFGTGFYLTSDREQATNWANLTVKRRKSGDAMVTVFEIDEERMGELCIRRFPAVDGDWLRYVSANRRGVVGTDGADIVIGAVADDRTMAVISLYFAGIYDEAETVRRLLPQRLKDQYAFKTEQALQILTLREVLHVG